MKNDMEEATISYCTSHPSEEVVGICASCLRERLYSLKAKKQPRRRLLEIVYSSESDSCGEIHEDSFGIQTPISDNYAVANHEIIPGKKFLWMAAKANKFHSSAQKKERRAFSALRSLFHRLRKSKEIKQDTCISHDGKPVFVQNFSSNFELKFSFMGVPFFRFNVARNYLYC